MRTTLAQFNVVLKCCMEKDASYLHYITVSGKWEKTMTKG
jgi:hypothetical protein